jgi:hypothetical protein
MNMKNIVEIIGLLNRLVSVATVLAMFWLLFLSLMFSTFDPRERASRDSINARESRQIAILQRQDSLEKEQQRLEKNRKHEAFLRAVQQRKDSIRRFDSARIGYFLYRLDSVRQVGVALWEDSAKANK